MPEIDLNAVLRMLASIGAKLLLLAFLTPFLILLVASTYALAASRLGTLAGWAASALIIIVIAGALNHWLWLVRSEKT